MSLLTLSGLLSTQALALDVVATAPSMGALVREVSGTGKGITVLAEPNRDLHSLQAKPSMIRALRDADLLVALGAELEVGWLPAAINSAANRRIQPGQPGYFEAAAQVPLLEVGGAADRAGGDVHPVSNPHVDMDPRRMRQIADALAERLALLDPSGAERYRRNAAAFDDKVERRMGDWYGANRMMPSPPWRFPSWLASCLICLPLGGTPGTSSMVPSSGTLNRSSR